MGEEKQNLKEGGHLEDEEIETLTLHSSLTKRKKLLSIQLHHQPHNPFYSDASQKVLEREEDIHHHHQFKFTSLEYQNENLEIWEDDSLEWLDEGEELGDGDNEKKKKKKNVGWRKIGTAVEKAEKEEEGKK